MSLLVPLIVVSALVTALGWIKQTWFFSVGYAFSVVTMSLLVVREAWGGLSVLAAIQLGLLMVWGLRLGLFLLVRERAASYGQRPEADRGLMPAPVRLAIWVMCLLLYPAMVSPAASAARQPSPSGGWLVVTVIGLGLLALGITIEALADHQKQQAKRSEPRAFVASGLYGWVRVPNYLGEIMVWVGNFLAGAHALRGLGWIIALVGLGTLIFIMIGATRRLERTQAERYGDDPSFRRYVSTVPVLLPWVPLYSVRSWPVPEL